ncbi:MAG TPA: hypothetical protein VF670_01060 [Duganella sp.]|jgi:hypothetical protein
MKHQFLAIDEGHQKLSLIDTTNPRYGWTRSLADFPGACDMQRIAQNRALIGFERGFFELSISSGEVLAACDRWKDVRSACRLVNGATLVTGHNLDGSDGINVLTLDREYRRVSSVRRDGDYVRLMRTTVAGTYLLCMNDHILETDTSLISLNAMRAPGFEHAWKAERMADGTTLVSAGQGAFMARFDRRGNLATTFGNAGGMPEETSPFFYATFQVLDDGRVVVANWQGHGPENGNKGRQLLEFSAAGKLLDSWSDPHKISSLQGVLVL